MKNKLTGKDILITGGLGFIGSNLAIKLVELGAKVEIYDSLIREFGGNIFNIKPIGKDIKVTLADMRDLKKISRAVLSKDLIFNLSGTLSHVDSMNNPFIDLDINCRAQLCLLESCKKVNRKTTIIFAGTRNQYGRALYSPVDETHVQEPTDINGINSIAAEKYHFLYSRIYGIETVSLRMTNTYGPRHQMKHSKQGVLNWFVRQIIDGNTIELYGDGLQVRDTNYIDDVVDALVVAAISKKAKGQVYNLGGSPLTLLDFVKKIIKIYGKGKYKMIKFPRERASIEVGNYIADTKKIKGELKWQARTSVDDGIKKTLDYYSQFKKHYW